MSIFELCFIVCFLAGVCVLISALISVIRGRYGAALRKLWKLGMGIAIYMAVVLGAAVLMPRKVYRLKENRCFDDWCLEVATVTRTSDAVEVGLRLSSRAKRVPQGEKGTVVYLTDSRGGRYDPVADSSMVPFDRLLQPGEAVMATRRFAVPEGVTGLKLIYTHEAGFPIGFFIVGQNHWFHGPAVVALD